MCGHTKSTICTLFIIAIVILSSSNAFPYISMISTINEVALNSDAVISGRVISIRNGRKVPPENNRWKLPLIHKYAVIDIYRVYASKESTTLPSNGKATIDYSSIDSANLQKGVVPMSGPSFPRLTIGEIYAFPVRQSPDNSGRFVLTDEEDNFGLMISCVRKQIPNAKTDSALDFIYSELAGTFAYGDYNDICSAARYLSTVHFGSVKPNSELPKELSNLVETNVRDNERADSGGKSPAIPGESRHPFRRKVATDSGLVATP